MAVEVKNKARRHPETYLPPCHTVLALVGKDAQGSALYHKAQTDGLQT